MSELLIKTFVGGRRNVVNEISAISGLESYSMADPSKAPAHALISLYNQFYILKIC